MLRLFQSLFGAEPVAKGRYPESTVQAGIERALDASDTRIRTLRGFEAKLRPAVLRAFDHVVDVVDGLPPILDLDRAGYTAQPLAGALFASVEHMRQVLAGDAALADFLASAEGARCSEVNALMLVQRSERNVLGMELQGEIVRREVAQVAVSFGRHHLLDPAADWSQCKRRLYRRAYDHILGLALERIGRMRTDRADLKRERELLKRKRAELQAGRWDLDTDAAGSTPVALIERRIDELNAELLALGGDTQVIAAHLDALCEVLSTADTLVRTTNLELLVDRMGIKHERVRGNTLSLPLQELSGGRGGVVVAQPVRIVRAEFPRRPDLLAEAQKYLG